MYFTALAGFTLSSADGVGSASDLSHELAIVRAAEAERVRVLAEAATAVVCIFANPSLDNGGSGVLIDAEGYGLTNFHVVAEFLESGGYGGLNDGKLYPLRVLGVDPGGDVAMFKLEGKARALHYGYGFGKAGALHYGDEGGLRSVGFPFAALGDSDALRVGQAVAALGNPFLLAEDFTPTITVGVVSGLHRYQSGQENALEYADCIQVSTSINPGNSGGPLFDMSGRVVGINGRASFEERGRVNVGLGYAITTQQIRRFIPGLRAGRTVLHGTLGATVRRAGDDLIFDAIQALSPAEKAGIELGDELVAIDGRAIKTGNEFNNAISPLPANWPVTLTLRRNGVQRDVTARLEPLPVSLGSPIIPEAENNRRALEWQVRRFWEARGGRVPAGTVEAVVAIVDPSGEGAVAAEERRVVIAGGGNAAFEESGDATGGAPASAAAAGDAMVEEWRSVVGLLMDGEVRSQAEVLGGDLCDGRVVTVVERRVVGEAVVRWSFDLETHALLRATIGAADEPERVVWTARAGEENLPRHWTRVERGRSVDLMVRSVEQREGLE